MNTSQVRQMDFIYTAGDRPGWAGWFSNNYLVMLLTLAAIHWGVPNEPVPELRRRWRVLIATIRATIWPAAKNM